MIKDHVACETAPANGTVYQIQPRYAGNIDPDYMLVNALGEITHYIRAQAPEDWQARRAPGTLLWSDWLNKDRYGEVGTVGGRETSEPKGPTWQADEAAEPQGNTWQVDESPEYRAVQGPSYDAYRTEALRLLASIEPADLARAQVMATLALAEMHFELAQAAGR